MMRPWNFSAGPATLPLSVLQQAREEMCDWQGTGMSVMEMSHRGKHFMRIYHEAHADLRDLLQVPEEFAILFMQGGAQGQNAIVPLNLMARSPAHKADYVLAGSWSVKSHKEAQRYGDVAIAASSATAAVMDGANQEPWTWYPKPEQWRVRPDAAYLHVCSNETIGGVEFTDWPQMQALGAPDAAQVVDASSNILAHPVDFSRIGLLYAGAQKNAGIAGMTIVIVRRDLLGHALPHCPSVFDYANAAQNDSMFNTPPTYAIYLAGLVFRWVKAQGGVAALQAQNLAKAQALYHYLDSASLYFSKVHPGSRSRMNVPFFLRDAALEDDFLAQAERAGLLALRGHKSVGGMRASLYNAMPMQGVQDLIAFLKDYEQRHG